MRRKLALLTILALMLMLNALPTFAYVNNNAIGLDGSGDYIEIPADSSFDFGNGITVEAWVRPDALNRNQVVLHKKDGSNNGMWLGLDSSNRFEWLFRVNGSEPDLRWTPTPAFATGTWHHLAWTYNPITGIGRGYVDGAQVGETWLQGPLTFNNTDPWLIGADTDGSAINDYWQGAIDDVRLWNSVRTGPEIAAFRDVQLTGSEPGLIGYWKLDEAAGTATAADTTANANAGTLKDNADFVDATANPMKTPVAAADIRVYPTTLAFYETEVGKSQTLPFEIANVGQADLTVTLTSDNARFSPLPASATVPGGTSRVIDVQFSPNAAGTETGTVTVGSNDTDTPSVVVNVSGDAATVVNRAATFDNNNDYIQMLTNIPETNLTIEFWFRTTNAYAGFFGVQKGHLGANGSDRHIYLYNGQLRQRVYSNEVLYSQRTGLNDDQWHHVAMVIQQDVGQRMYIDGVLEASGSKDRSDFTMQDRFVLGYSNDRGWYGGLLDELRIWSVARGQGALNAFKDQRLTGNEPGLFGYWRLDDGPGSRFATDTTGSQPEGFLFGNTTFVGAGRTETLVPAGATLTVYPTSLDFGNVQVGDSVELLLDVTNRGQATLTVSNIASSDAQVYVSPDPFPVGNQPATTGLVLPYGRSEKVRVRYTPSSAAALNATLTFTSNDAASPLALNVAGNGVLVHKNAVTFDGNGDGVTIPYDPALRTDQWTMEIWARPTTVETARRGIMGSGWSWRDFYIGIHSKKFYVWLYNATSTPVTIHANAEYAAGQWYHLAAAYDGRYLRFYVNGVLQGSATYNWQKDTLPFYLGRTHGGEYFNGVLDEARFWNIGRTGPEIQATWDTPVSEKATGLAAYWTMNQAPTSSSVRDMTGNGHNGSLDGNAHFIPSDAPIQQPSGNPGLVFSPNKINFGIVTYGNTAGSTVIVFNKGKQVLDVSTLRTTNPVFAVLPTQAKLVWGERQEVRVAFKPQAPGSQIGRLEMLSNAAPGKHSVLLLGVGKDYLNRAVKLDGNGDLVTVLHDAILNVGRCTVEAWVKPQGDMTGKGASIVRKGKSNSNTPFILEQLYNQEGSGTEELMMWVNNGSGWYKNSRSAYNRFAFVPGTWYHLAGTYDGSKIRLYVNGRLLSMRSYTAGTNGNSEPLQIGGRSTDRWFKGLIDEVRVFDHARSQAEINAMMNITLTGKEAGLIGYWPFDDQPGSRKAADGSGHRLAGTLSGDADFVSSDAPLTRSLEGPDIAIFPPVIEMGVVQQNSTVEGTLVVINRGRAELQVSGITSNKADVIPTLKAFPLLPGEKMEVPMLLTPTTVGDFAATITVASDDPDTPSAAATLIANVTNTVSISNQVLVLDGSSDHVQVPDADSLDLTDNFTLEAWVKVKNYGYHSIFEKQGSYVWTVVNGSVYWALMTSGAWEYHNTNVPVTYGEWTHLTLVYTSPNVKVYKNGTLRSTIADPQGGNLDTTADVLRIGGRANGEWYNGSLDEVRIWNDVRTQSEIRQNMFSMLTGSEANLVGYWPFSAGGDDASQQGNDGTLQADAKILDSDPELPPMKGDVNRNGLITEYDAVQILQASLGFRALNILRFYAADVTNNWDVTPYDASLVMQFAAGIINAFPAPTVGPQGLLPAGTLANMGELRSSGSDRILVPIEINSLAGVLAAQVALAYDPARLEPVQVLRTDLTSAYQIAYEAQDGQLRASVASASAGTGSGEMLLAEFRVLQAPLKDRYSAVRLLDVVLNEGQTVELHRDAPRPERTTLLANYPNPFNPETWMPYLLAEDASVTLRIYSSNGHLVRQISLGRQEAGSYATQERAAYWDGRNDLGESVASGVYFYTLQAGDFVATRRLTILR